jgi:hypothetical protein
MSMKNSNDTIGNRTRDPPVCSAVPRHRVPLSKTCYRANRYDTDFSIDFKVVEFLAKSKQWNM